MIRSVVVLFAVLSVAVCTNGQVNSTSGTFGKVGSPDFVSDRLYFGQSIPGGRIVSDSAWRVFLADVVTPRFPSGLTVWQAQGQWKNSYGELEHEMVIVVEVIHPAGSPADSVFAVIAKTWCDRFAQEAVMRTTGPVQMQMYNASNH